MPHITQDQASLLCRSFGPVPDDMTWAQALCNAAIEWYIAQQAAPTKEPAPSVNAMLLGALEKIKRCAATDPSHSTTWIEVASIAIEAITAAKAEQPFGRDEQLENVKKAYSQLIESVKNQQTRINELEAAQAAPKQEPVAYFDFQEHGFYWAPNTKVVDVPVSIKVAPMPLYSKEQT